jgi:hypothetical protein
MVGPGAHVDSRFLGKRRTPLTETGGLFERVRKLQNTEVRPGAADVLHANWDTCVVGSTK